MSNSKEDTDSSRGCLGSRRILGMLGRLRVRLGGEGRVRGRVGRQTPGWKETMWWAKVPKTPSQ